MAKKGKLKYTTEEVVKQFRVVHGDRYDYSKFEYLGAHTKAVVICKDHKEEFLVRPVFHRKGSGCRKCGIESATKSKTYTAEQFLEKARAVHGTKFDYSLVDYTSFTNKTTIICPKHGSYEMTPAGHLRGYGCIKCAREAVASAHLLTTEDFIRRSKIVHNDFYGYQEVEYKSVFEKVKIFCPKHNKFFFQVPSYHLGGSGCNLCGREAHEKSKKMTPEQFIQKAKSVHGEVYRYDVGTVLKGVDRKAVIGCKKCGVFEQNMSDHLSGSGCGSCTPRGWNRSKWVEYCKGKVAKLYVIHCYNETESFIKIGRTARTVKQRFPGKTSMPYNYTLLKLVKSKDPAYIYDLENRAHSMFKKRKYTPLIHFEGYTECFTHININSKPPK